MMGVADSLERAADLIAQNGIGLATALSATAKTGRAFADAKEALLESTGFSTLGDYVAMRGGRREIIVEDLRKAAVAARGGEVRP
jgi:hypothetical protein